MDNNYPYVTDLVALAREMIDKTDKTNQRLVNSIICITIAFCLCLSITIVGITYLYFTTDYGYGTNQTQINTQNSNQTIKGGN